ncbi:MAG: T9SS type A sorting domain-containing protein [Syntrophothermus sp.]
MKKIYLFLIITALLSSATIFYKSTTKFQRKWYETVLKAKFDVKSFARLEKEGNKAADQPDMAALQDYFMTADPATGSVPRERLFAVYQQLKDSPRYKSTRGDIQWTGYPVTMGGRTRAMMYDPDIPKKVWAGSVTGGLWYNNDITNANSSWTPVNDFWSCLSIRCITFDPNNHGTFYLGTGEPETAIQTYRESSGLGNGIWKSTDSGHTWNPIASTSGFAYITKILVRNEGGSSVIYAGVVSGLYQGVHNSQPSDGLFRSTDGGNTWTQVLPNINGTTTPYSPADIVMGADGRIYVGSMPNLEAKGGATILYSDSGLPGSWNVNTSYKTMIESDPDYPIPGRVILATAPSDPNRVYALIAQGFVNPVNNYKYFYCFHILKSSDKAGTWTDCNLPNDLTSGISFVTIGWHAMDATVDPNNPDVLWVGGLDLHKTSDGGNTWKRVSDWSLMYYGGGNQYVHADQHLMLFKEGSSTEMIFGSDGGVFYTNNANSYSPQFQERNLDYNTLQFYSADIKEDFNEEILLGGLQDNGCEYYSGSPMSINSMVSGGDGAYCFFDKNAPEVFLTSCYYNAWYVFMNGLSYNYLGDWGCGIFVNPSDYDDQTQTLYSNACDFINTNLDYICRINNVVNGPTGGYLKLNTTVNTWFSAVKLSPYQSSGSSVLIVSSQSGRLFKVNHAEGTPVTTEITGADFPVGNISSIDVGSSNDELLVTFSNYGVASVWYTADGGLSWKNKEGNLPDMPVRWGIFHPVNKKQVMLATEAGIWSTHLFDQDEVFWVQSTTGMANVRVDMLNYRGDYTVVAATHGRGLFTANWDNMLATDNQPKTSFAIYPNPVKDIINISYNPPSEQQVIFSLTDQSGRRVITTVKTTGAGNHLERLNISEYAPGMYYLSMYCNGKSAGTTKIIKID